MTDAELARILQIEELLNELQTIVKNNLMTKAEARQTILIKQSEIDSLKQRVSQLESQLELLQNRLD